MRRIISIGGFAFSRSEMQKAVTGQDGREFRAVFSGLPRCDVESAMRRFDVEKNCVILKKLPKCEFLLWVARENCGRAAGVVGAQVCIRRAEFTTGSIASSLRHPPPWRTMRAGTSKRNRLFRTLRRKTGLKARSVTVAGSRLGREEVSGREADSGLRAA